MSLLAETLDRLFTRHVTPALRREVAQTGALPGTLWQAVADAGVLSIFSEIEDPWPEAAAVFLACGAHAVPAPVAETVLAHGLARLPAGDDPVGLAVAPGPVGPIAAEVAWGRVSRTLVLLDEAGAARAAAAVGPATPGRALCGDPRDNVPIGPSVPGQTDALAWGAVMRACQMAGGLETILAMTLTYARDRVQFGKPISAFQAVQHQVAVLAAETAAARRAADAAVEALAAGRAVATEAAIAKIRVGEAAAVAARIAHQVHGALGFTEEHELHRFTRRLWTWRTEFGSEAEWAVRLGAGMAGTGADALWPRVTALG